MWTLGQLDRGREGEGERESEDIVLRITASRSEPFSSICHGLVDFKHILNAQQLLLKLFC